MGLMFPQNRKACMDCVEGKCDKEHKSCDMERINMQTTFEAFPYR